MSERILDARHIVVRRGGRDVVRGIDLSVDCGERVALVGPNAAGKSTLLSAFAGLLPAVEGKISVSGKNLADFSSRELARIVAFVVSVPENSTRLSVRESTDLGRYPHVGPLQPFSDRDLQAVDQALTDTDLVALADRPVDSLSAGERQRALVARALAQQPGLLLLDEPSAHLDVGHGLDLFARLSTIAARNVGIVAVIHDLATAAQWATRMVVLNDGRIVADGEPSAVMRGAPLSDAFGVTIKEAQTANAERTWRFDRRT